MLHVHRSERSDRLVEALAEVLRAPPADPFAPEVVAVPAKGVERWLTQRLSHVLGAGDGGGAGDGVCANVEFPPPGRLVAEAVSVGSGVAAEDDPWQQGRLLWIVLDAIDECAAEAWCAPLAGHLGVGAGPDDHRRGRRLSAAQHLSRLYDTYGASRPAMIRDWSRGADTDGAGADLPPDLRWQAELWRRTRERIGAPSPAERLEPACATLRERPDAVDLPERLSLFGPTRLTTAQLEVLAALADGRDVHLWIPHPSPALWDKLKGYADGAVSARRHGHPSADVPRNPLLASLGRDAREAQLQLGAGAAAADHHHPVGDRPATVLGRLQQALQDDAAPAAAPPAGTPAPAAALAGPPPTLDPADRTLQVHACHGPARQVEVLREVLVGMLADDPTLEPRDVLVMCPDIEDYAPLISATFGLQEEGAEEHHPGHRLRVRLADRSLRQTNPLLATVAALLELADARVTASEVLDLAGSPPVRRRFRFSDDDLERLQGWVRAAGIRWGLSAAHRERFGLRSVGQNTWRAGLDRLLLGAAMAEGDGRWVGTALPVDDVDSNDIDLAGRLGELVDRLGSVLGDLAGERPLTEWVATLTAALDKLTNVREEDAWQSAQADRELAQVTAEAGERAATATLSLADVRALLADRLRGRPTRANFRTGNLTMCSMVPMRSVPHRVVCLLGLDDSTFPRTSGVDGDDVLARDPCVGERDPRSEDRQLLLDAVLAAREHLVILYTGADPRTNAAKPPAVPVGEILDAVDAAVRVPDGGRARDHVVVHHPLQPFDARNFTVGALGPARPFSYDVEALSGARRAADERHPPEPFLPNPLPPPDPEPDVALDDLIRFLEHPVRGFLRDRLGLTLPQEEEEVADAITVEPTALDKWAVGDRLLQRRLAGAPPDRCRQAELLRGELPPGRLGERLLDGLLAEVEPLVAAGAQHQQLEARAVDAVVELGDRRLVGTVPGVRGATLVRVVYSRLGAKHRLRAWVQLLALSAAHPSTEWTALTIGRGKAKPVARSMLLPVPAEVARRQLIGLLSVYGRGLCQPLPMALKTSEQYAAKRSVGAAVKSALDAARGEWVGDKFGGERDEPAHVYVWGTAPAMDALLAEAWDDPDEATLFGALAAAVWEPLIAHEQLERG